MGAVQVLHGGSIPGSLPAVNLMKDKEGLAGKFKILGQVSLGIIVAATLYLSDDVVVREKVRNAKGDFVKEIVVDNETGQQEVRFVTKEMKSTKTTLPFIKNHEFDYAWIIRFAGESSSYLRWLIYAVAIILIITAVSNAANLTDGIDGLATGTSARITSYNVCYTKLLR